MDVFPNPDTWLVETSKADDSISGLTAVAAISGLCMVWFLGLLFANCCARRLSYTRVFSLVFAFIASCVVLATFSGLVIIANQWVSRFSEEAQLKGTSSASHGVVTTSCLFAGAASIDSYLFLAAVRQWKNRSLTIGLAITLFLVLTILGATAAASLVYYDPFQFPGKPQGPTVKVCTATIFFLQTPINVALYDVSVAGAMLAAAIITLVASIPCCACMSSSRRAPALAAASILPVLGAGLMMLSYPIGFFTTNAMLCSGDLGITSSEIVASRAIVLLLGLILAGVGFTVSMCVVPEAGPSGAGAEYESIGNQEAGFRSAFSSKEGAPPTFAMTYSAPTQSGAYDPERPPGSAGTFFSTYGSDEPARGVKFMAKGGRDF